MNNKIEGIEVENFYGEAIYDLEKVHEHTSDESLVKALIQKNGDTITCYGLNVAYDTNSSLHRDAVLEAGLNIGYGLDQLAKISIYKNGVKNKLKELGYTSLQEWAINNKKLVWDPSKDIIELD